MLPGVEWLASHLAHFTHAAVFLLLFLSSFGLPVPEEVTLVSAGLLVHEGLVRFPTMLAVGLVGVLAGDLLVYSLGRRYGEGILRHRILAEWLTPDILVRIGELERRYGALALVAARFLPGLKTAAMLAAGVFGTPRRRFFLADGLGALGSVSAALGLGYLFADHLDEAVSAMDRLHIFLLGLLGLLLLALLVHLWARRRLGGDWRAAAATAAIAVERDEGGTGAGPPAEAGAGPDGSRPAVLRERAEAAGAPRPPA